MKMLRRAHAYQKSTFLSTLDNLRDEFDRMDDQLSEITSIYRNKLPSDVIAVTSFAQFDSFAQKLYERNNIFRKPYDVYIRMRGRILEVTESAERHLLSPLLLVYSMVETEQQRKLKQKMRVELRRNRERLTRDFDWSALKHSVYNDLIPKRDHVFFLGMICVVALGKDALSDVYQLVDEYWSGIDRNIKLHD